MNLLLVREIRTFSFQQKKDRNKTSSESNVNFSAEQSRVWKFFNRIDKRSAGSLQTQCQITGCEKILPTPTHSTTTFARHLRDVHKMEQLGRNVEASVVRKKEKLPISLKKKIRSCSIGGHNRRWKKL